jgi:hypothetical protein
MKNKMTYDNFKEEGGSGENSVIPHFGSTTDNSLIWRLWHSINYIFGGIFFVLGSFCYYPEISTIVNGDVLGGWLFTVGSANFLLADITEWNHFRFGCIGGNSNQPLRTVCTKLKRAQFGINFFTSAIGSLLYLLGSIFFIPATNLLYQGEILFIVGSLVIFFSQLWKCVRTAVTNEGNNEKNSMLNNIKADFSGFNIDLWAGMGGLFYAIGTYVFKNTITSDDLLNAVNLFVIGGSCFFLSGVFMQYRYYCSKTENQNKIDAILTP